MAKYVKCLGVFFIFLISPVLAAENPTVIPQVNSHVLSGKGINHNGHSANTRINREQIKETPKVLLSDLLRQEQSVVRVTNSGSNSSQTILSIRGFGDNAVANTLILIDGFPLVNPSLLPPDFNSIALSDIERVDILQSSEGSLWGDQAVGGVVNIITRHPEKWVLETVLGLGSFNKNYMSGYVANKFNQGLFVKSFVFLNQTHNYRKHNREEDGSFSTQMGWDYAKGTVSAKVQFYRNKFQYPGSLTLQQYLKNSRQASNFRNISYLESTLLQLLNKHALTNDWLIETRLQYFANNSHGFVYFPYRSQEASTYLEPRLIGHFRNSTITLGTKVEWSDYQLINTRSKAHANAKEKDIYGQIIIPIVNTFDLTLGGRIASLTNTALSLKGEHIASSNTVLVTEQGFLFKPTSELQFFIRRSGNFRLPKANEIIWTTYPTKELHIQRGVSYEMGSRWQNDYDQFTLSLYQLELFNEIAFDPMQTPTQPFGTYRNFDHTKRRGVSITNTAELFNNLKLNTQLNYVQATFVGGYYSGNQIPAVPAFNGNVGLIYKFMPNLKARWDANYTGSRYPSEDVANQSKKDRAYWLHSLALEYIFKPFYVTVEVFNLFNQRFSTFTMFDPIDNTNSYNPGPGRNYLLTIRFNTD